MCVRTVAARASRGACLALVVARPSSWLREGASSRQPIETVSRRLSGGSGGKRAKHVEICPAEHVSALGTATARTRSSAGRHATGSHNHSTTAPEGGLTALRGAAAEWAAATRGSGAEVSRLCRGGRFKRVRSPLRRRHQAWTEAPRGRRRGRQRRESAPCRARPPRPPPPWAPVARMRGAPGRGRGSWR